MIRFAADAITAFSVVPLMASMTIGWVMAAVGFAFFVYSIVGWLVGANLPGWTSLMAAVGLLGGMQFLMLGIIGAYLGRLYDQSKGRPLFMIRDIVGRPEVRAGRVRQARRALRRRPRQSHQAHDGRLGRPVHRREGALAAAPRARPGGRRHGLLDYGCGAGDLMRVLAGLGARASLHRLRRVDRHAGRGRRSAGRQRSGRRRTLAAQDGARTPFADGQFDVATISAVLHHVPRRPSARPSIAELGRVLKPGGRLYVFEHNPRNPLVRYVIARTPIDENAILLDEQRSAARPARHGALRARDRLPDVHAAGHRFPARRSTALLAWLPLGAQYAVAARKPA